MLAEGHQVGWNRGSRPMPLVPMLRCRDGRLFCCPSFKPNDEAQMENVTMDTIVSLAKRRGFVFPSSEIYGGFSSTYDYGPLGVGLKRNIKNLWLRDMVQRR